MPAIAVSTSPAPLIEAKELGIQRDSRWLIRHVDLQVRPGEIVTLIGPNGSGKSTTARAVLGLLEPDEGAVHRRSGLRIGYVPQQFQVDPVLPMSVARLINLTRTHPVETVHQALDACGVAHLRTRQVHQLSGGEMQRALLARAMVSSPDLLVLDEPVQGVDFNGEIELYDLIHRWRERSGCGVLLISHDLHIVMAHTDSVICLNGHVCCHGSPQMVAGNPEYIRLFGRRGADALAIYRHDHDHTHLPDGRIRPHRHHHDTVDAQGHAHVHDGVGTDPHAACGDHGDHGDHRHD